MKKFLNKFNKISLLVIFLTVVILTCVFLNISKGKASDSGDRIHFISVQKADAMIVESNGHYGLIDAANPDEVDGKTFDDNGAKVLKYAKALGVQYFDFVIMTHSHYDHIGGIPELAELFNNKTIVFYKEDKISRNSNNTIDDYEELDNYYNNDTYEDAIDALDAKGAKTCDVTKINQSQCTLSSLNNGFITSVSFDQNNGFEYNTNVKENLSFTFGDFDIKLYNLHLISYHLENYNSIVTYVRHRTGGATAALTGDVEAGIGDSSYMDVLSNKSNLIAQPTGSCTKCKNLGLENQVADVIGNVTLLKSAHHGNLSSNSVHALSTYQPKYYVVQGEGHKNSNGVYPELDATAAQIIYLKGSYNTKSYFAMQSEGALVAQFNDNSSTDLAISTYDYDNSNNIEINNNVDYAGSYFSHNGWQHIHINNFDETSWAYVRNNQAVVNDWAQSDSNWYYFGSDGLMATGLIEANLNLYYLSEDDDTIGIMQTGWQKINGYWYYFDTTSGAAKRNEWYVVDGKTYYFDQNGRMAIGLVTAERDNVSGLYYFSEDQSTLGVMQTGWKKLNNEWYYFDTSTGKGKQSEFDYIGRKYYYFDNQGKMVTGLQYLEYAGFYDYYYFSTKPDLIGIMQTGWVEINGDWYYFTSSGRAYKNGWYTIGGNSYYFYDNAKMATGVQYLTKNNNAGYYYLTHKSDTTNYSDSVEVHIQNQTDLNNYLSNTGHDMTGDQVYFENTEDITFPEGEVYYFDNSKTGINTISSYWYLTTSSKGNINFNSSTFLVGSQHTLYLHATGDHLKNFVKQKISNGSFYGSVNVKIDSNGAAYSDKGNFNADLIHASNIEFKDLTFNNIQDVNDHIFDVMGCNNITFDGITIKGYFGNYTLDELKAAYSNSDHSLYAEAIQIDVANPSASGISNLNQTPIFNSSMSDGVASKNITITNSYFGPYNGATGQSIIDKSNETVIIPYGPTIGAHDEDRVNYSSYYNNINVTGNSFVNTIYMTEDYMNSVTGYSLKSLYPIHMQTHTGDSTDASYSFTIQNNTFINQYTGYTGYGEYVYGHRGYYGNGENNNVTQTNPQANSTVNNASSVKEKITKLGIQQTGWKYVDDYWYYFRPANYYDGGAEGTAVEGFGTVNNVTYYFRTSANQISTGPRASMVKGFATIDNNTYYFRNSKDEITTGPEGGMITGLASINNNTYYFRETATGGPIGSMLKNECKTIDNTNYCFDASGIGVETSNIPIPTSTSCLNPTYDGSEKTLANAGTGYTLSNNSGTNAGSYTVTAVLSSGYLWSDNSNGNKTFNCSIIKANLQAPSITNYNGIYDGAPHQVSLTNSNNMIVNYSTDGTNYSSTIPSRTNAGTTTVYVKYIGGTNYFDSSVSTGSISISKANPTITKTNELNSVVEGYDGRLLSISSNVAGIFTFSTTSSNIEISTGPVNVSANEVINLNISAINTGDASIDISFIPTDGTNYNAYQGTKDFVITDQIIVNSVATIPTANDYCKNNLVYDGNQKVLTNAHGEGYTFVGNTGTNAGSYTVTAVLDEHYEWSDSTTTNKTIECSIAKANLETPIVVGDKLPYDGQAHTVSVSNELLKTVYYSTDGIVYSTTKPTRTNAGTTTVYVKFIGDQNHNDSEVASDDIVISKANSGVYTSDYDRYFDAWETGKVITVRASVPGIFTFSTEGNNFEILTGPTVVNANESVDVNIRAVGVGTSELVIHFVPTDTSNYNDTTYRYDVTVNSKKVYVPLSHQYCVNNIQYDGQSHVLTTEPGEGYTFINNTATNAGTYQVRAHLKDGYEWWGENSTEDKIIECTISRIELEDFTVTNYGDYYDGQPHGLTVTPVDGGTIKYSLDGSEWQTEPFTFVNAGSYTIYVKAFGDQNHRDSNYKIASISIYRLQSNVQFDMVHIGSLTQYKNSNVATAIADVAGTFTFEVDDEIIDNYQPSIHASANEEITFSARGYEVGSTTLRMNFTPDDPNYSGAAQNVGIRVWPNSSTIDIPTSGSVCANNLVYNGSVQTLTKDEPLVYQYSNNTGINAGSYDVTVSLIHGYTWSDDTTEDKTVTCSIGKADLDIPTITGYNGTYDGSPHSINVSEVSGATIKYSLDNQNYTTFVPSRTDVGSTLVYVKYIGDSNHNDSSVYSASINVSKADSVISSMNLADTIEQDETIEIGPIHANVAGIFTITSNDASKLTVPVIYESVNKNEDITINITGAGVGATSYTITFTPTSSNYNASSITTDITVTEKVKTPVAIPTSNLYCKANLKYNGSPITLTNDPEVGYTFSNNIQTNAGTYEVTATLQDGYIWVDNATSNKTFNCTILNQDDYLTFNNNLVVSNGYIKPKLNPGSTVGQIKSMIDTNGTITSSKSDDEIVSTCDTITISFNESTNTYSLIILGDITKNGLTTSDDVNLLFRYLRNKETLSECQLKASDTTNDTNIFINDVAKLYQFINGKIERLDD